MRRIMGAYRDAVAMYQRKTKKRSGFTMIELIVVVLIIGFLVTMSMLDFGKNAEDAKIAVAKGDVRNILGAVIMYRADTGSYPSDNFCSDLTSSDKKGKNDEAVGPWMNTCPAKNPWGNPYQIDTSGKSPYVYTEVGANVSSDGGTYITSKDLTKIQATKDASSS